MFRNMHIELSLQQWPCPLYHLGLHGHAESKGEENIKEHNGHDADCEPNDEVLVVFDLVCEGGVAALEVEAWICAIVIWIIGPANLKHENLIQVSNHYFLFTVISSSESSSLSLPQTQQPSGLLKLGGKLKLASVVFCQSLKLSIPQHFNWKLYWLLY